MKKVAIIGGKLQGTEAVYLAKKAGIQSLLIDKNPMAPASGFCDEHAVLDVLEQNKQLISLLSSADFILPALEDDEVLEALEKVAKEHHLKLAFDMEAYRITSSKLKSDQIIRENCIPAPVYYPKCDPPYIIKPSGESGSAGVRYAETDGEVKKFLEEVSDPSQWVVQEYLKGRSYSIEVIGSNKGYRTYEITEIHMDERYDCCRVTAPCPVSRKQKGQFEEVAVKLAKLVGLTGIMDVEVIDDKGEFKVLEIDARIPSQTPMVVYHTSGVNLLSELMEIALHGEFQKESAVLREKPRYSCIEHYLVDSRGIWPMGEHIMGEGGPLTYHLHSFGADEVLTDYDGKRRVWRGTFINSANTKSELEEKREKVKSYLQELVY